MTAPGRRWVLAAGLALLSACDVQPDSVRRDARRRRLAAAGVEALDGGAGLDLAGVSALRRIEIDALGPDAPGVDTTRAAYRLLRTRCGTCHAVPDPASKPPYQWSGVMIRMRRNVVAAGLLPTEPAEEDSITSFLRERAASRR